MKKILLLLFTLLMLGVFGCSENEETFDEKTQEEQSEEESENESEQDSSENNKQKKALESAESKAEEELYLEAMNILEKYLASHKNDSVVEEQFLIYEEQYVAQQIEEAEAVFTDYTQYKEAIKIIRTALQNCPDNEELLSQKEYYEEYESVALYSLTPYKDKHGFIHVSGSSDGFGNEYSDCIIKSEYNHSTYGVYDVSYKYNKFTATVFSRSDHSAESVGTLNIYGDEELIYQKTDIDIYGRPFDIEVDITGIQDLKIEFTSNAYAEIFGLTNAVLQKTTK